MLENTYNMKRIKLFEEHSSDLPSIQADDLAMDIADYLSETFDCTFEFTSNNDFSISKMYSSDCKTNEYLVYNGVRSYVKKNLYNHKDYYVKIYTAALGGNPMSMVVIVYKYQWLENLVNDMEDMGDGVYVTKKDKFYLFDVDEWEENIDFSYNNITYNILGDIKQEDLYKSEFINSTDLSIIFRSYISDSVNYVDNYTLRFNVRKFPHNKWGIRLAGLNLKKYL